MSNETHEKVVHYEMDNNRIIYPTEVNNMRGMIIEDKRTQEKNIVVYSKGKERDGRYLVYYDELTETQYFMFPNSTEIYKMTKESVAYIENSKFLKRTINGNNKNI